MTDKPCPDGEHQWSDIKNLEQVDDLLPYLEGFLTSDRWRKVGAVTNRLQLDEFTRHFLGIDFATGKDVAYLCLLGMRYLAKEQDSKK